MKKLFRSAYQVIRYFGTAAEIYLELIWTVLLGGLGYLCFGLVSKHVLEAPVKALILFHIWGLFYIVAKQPCKRLRRWQAYRKMKKVDQVQTLIGQLDSDEVAEQVQMMIGQLDRDSRINILQALGRDLVQEK